MICRYRQLFIHCTCSLSFPLQASIVDLQPTVETTIAAHDYNLRRIISQLNFYANDPRFHQLQLQQLLQQRQQQQQTQQQQQQLRVMSPLRLGLDLRCVAEIESYPQLMRETSLHALLFRDDIDLKNQKHFKSGECALREYKYVPCHAAAC